MVLGAAAGMLLTQFYRWFDHTAHAIAASERLPEAMANGIKHAYAAAESYAVLRGIGIGPATAESLVIALGTFNEYAESLFRDPPDSTAEVMKDMYNNHVGVTAARWHEAHREPRSRLEVILFLAHAGIVAAQPGDVQGMIEDGTSGQGPDIGRARHWFRTQRTAIVQKVKSAL